MDRQRIDKWLWHARVVRTRSAAAALVGGGMVRLNNERVEQPSRPVRPGDVVTIALDRSVRILKVTGYAERRGSADIARGLFEDLTPPSAPKPSAPPSGQRDEGSGRPTKRERRETDRLRGRDGFDLE
ncbi:MAG: RNA-binding S4 domain-containing protein [Xanthobacteraceae bacterium]|nr:RNA-binding S4 domain-containing protein [Xanthobacteraceae bacterium]